MKSSLVIVVSLILNVTLLAVLGLKLAEPGKSAPPPDKTSATGGASAPATRPGKESSTTAKDASKPSKHFTWEMVESEDYRKYIANLRAIGCPEETIRDIIVADVNKLFEARKDKLRSTRKKQEYWKPSSLFASMPDEEAIKQKQELSREKRALLTDLLGSAPEEKLDPTALLGPLEALFEFLPSSKQTEVFEIMQKFQAKMMKGMKGGMPDKEDMKRIADNQKEMEAEMAKIMTPQEFEDYQLRLSTTAMTMRMQLTSFDPTEQEYKDLFKLRKAFDEEFNPMLMGTLSKEESERRQAAQKELDEKTKKLLGEERFNEYTRSQDWNYQGISKTAERFNLPKESAVKVYDMKRIAEEQAVKVRNDPNFTGAKRDAALQAIRAETERSVQEVFGAEAYASYKNNGQASGWIDGIAPAEKPQPVVVPSP